MDDYPAVMEEAVRCLILWAIVDHPELRRLIGSGPNQVQLSRLVDLILNDWCEDASE